MGRNKVEWAQGTVAEPPRAVETTSLAAAKAMAALYAQTDDVSSLEDRDWQGLISTRREGNKTIYRIKQVGPASVTLGLLGYLRPRPNSLQGRRAKSSDLLHFQSKKRGLRMARSNPSLRPPNIKIVKILPDADGFFQAPGSADSNDLNPLDYETDLPPSSHHILPRGKSTLAAPVALRATTGTVPGLTVSSPDNLHTRGVYTGNKSYNDVLGSILGWSDMLQHVPQGSASAPSSPSQPTMRFSAASDDKATPRKAATLPRSNSSPFGSAVRLPPSLSKPDLARGQRGSLKGLFEDSAPQQPLESAASRQEEKRGRFESPTLFDVFQAVENAEHRSPTMLSSPSAGSIDGFSRHARMTSTSSLASASSRVTVHQITVTQSAGDDPRFAIWGLKQVKSADVATPATPTPPTSSGSSRRWSFSRRNSTSTNGPFDPSGREQGSPVSTQRILMAATIERWVAEITAKIEPELMADFFLTYRSYLSPQQLCQLLITRFEWALQSDGKAEDEAARRIVRVRTFVVFRHWLLNYFVEDFVPNSTLRTLLTNWINGMAHSSRVRESESDQRLIKGLKKVIKRLKDTYSTIGMVEAQGAAQLLAAVGHQAASPEQTAVQTKAPRKSTDTKHGGATDEEVDLDFDQTITTNSPPRLRVRGALRDLQSSPARASTDDLVAGTSPFTEHGPVSRAVTSTLGQISRLKRLMRPVSGLPGSKRANHAFEDRHTYPSLLYASSLMPEMSQSSPSLLHSSGTSPTSSSGLETPSDLDDRYESASPEPDTDPDPDASEPSDGLGISTRSDLPAMPNVEPTPTVDLRHSASSQTIKDTTQGLFKPTYDVFKMSRASAVQLDDIGFSDDSDEDEDALPRTLRRLPAARDLRHANALRHLQNPLRASTSRDTISSIGTTREPPNFLARAAMALRPSRASGSSDEGDHPGVAIIGNFVADGLESDDEEEGDVEAALRQLEGHIDANKRRQREIKVEEQMAKSKVVAGGGALPQSKLAEADLSESEEVGEALRVANPSSAEQPDDDAASSTASESRTSVASETKTNPDQLAPPASKSRLSILRQSLGKKSSKQVLSRASVIARASETLNRTHRLPNEPYRSFVLFCKTEQLARQFALIERDLLCNISWHELLHGSWRKQSASSDVSDWEAFIKDRAKSLVAARSKGEAVEPTEVSVAIARFNLVANWCASEIVMTSQLEERAVLIAKFIRLAWKCYRQHNFQTLTQLVHGLQSIYVERLAKTWSRVPIWEMRVFKDLKLFTSHVGNFRSLRAATMQRIESYDPMAHPDAPDSSTTLEHRTSMSLGSRKRQQTIVRGVIPFLGMYLRDLAASGELPTHLDPSCPSECANFDQESGAMTTLHQPSAFAGLFPLDQSSLYPLVNVHKARLLATTLQRVLVLQDMASLYQWEADAALFRKCLAIVALSSEEMQYYSYRAEQA